MSSFNQKPKVCKMKKKYIYVCIKKKAHFVAFAADCWLPCWLPAWWLVGFWLLDSIARWLAGCLAVWFVYKILFVELLVRNNNSPCVSSHCSGISLWICVCMFVCLLLAFSLFVLNFCCFALPLLLLLLLLLFVWDVGVVVAGSVVVALMLYCCLMSVREDGD